MDKRLETAAYCGLYCESCSAYIGSTEDAARLAVTAKRVNKTIDEVTCTGCRSEKLSFYCSACKMKECCNDKGLEFCYACGDYPCSTIVTFQKQMPHRSELFESLSYLKEQGLDSWCKKMKADYSCANCGTINSAYDLKCRKCGNEPSSDFNQRNKRE